MTEEEARAKVLEIMEGKIGAKSKFYLKDFYGPLKEFGGPRDVKNLINKMVREGLLEYWSSGSTTLFGLKGAGKQHQEEALPA